MTKIMTTILVGILLWTGCYSVQKQILSISFDPVNKDMIWQKAIYILSSQGVPVTLVDTNSGVITSDWYVSGTTVPFNNVREKVTITVSVIGKVLVNVQLQCLNMHDPRRGWIFCRNDLAHISQRTYARLILGDAAVPPDATTTSKPGGKPDGSTCYKNDQCASGACQSRLCTPKKPEPKDP